MRALRYLISLPAAALAGLLALPVGADGQELWGRGVPAGQVQLTIGGGFEYADRRLGDGAGLEGLASEWLRSDAATLLPGRDLLITSLRAATGDATWTPTAGPITGSAQVSRVTFPVRLRIGILDRLTLDARVTSRYDRVEGDFAILPVEGADIGVNPAFLGRRGEVDAFLTTLNEAATALGDAEWTDFYTALATAYQQGVYLPSTGSEIGDALQGRLAEFDAALQAAGLPAAALTPPLADRPLDGSALLELLASAEGPYRFQPLGTSLLTWNPGDVDVWLNWDLLREGGVNTIEGHGVSVRSGARLPYGTLENPNLHFDVGTGDGQTDLLFGIDGWLRRARWGVSGGFDVAAPLASTERGFRLLDDGEVIGRAVAFRLVDWTPGTAARLRLHPSLALAPGLWADATYLAERQGDGTFDLREDVAAGPGVDRVRDRSGWNRHSIGFGLRYRPPDLGEARLEVWSRWVGAVAGRGPATPAWSRLEVGGRIWRTLW